jgi:hypothetical protein
MTSIKPFNVVYVPYAKKRDRFNEERHAKNMKNEAHARTKGEEEPRAKVIRKVMLNNVKESPKLNVANDMANYFTSKSKTKKPPPKSA